MEVTVIRRRDSHKTEERMFFGFVGFLVLIMVGVAIVILIFANTVDQPSMSVGNVMLDCPHCGRETPSHLENCQYCGKSFRDSVVKSKDLENNSRKSVND
jgi:hypothetical protein